jgi:hypothetical protein
VIEVLDTSAGADPGSGDRMPFRRGRRSRGDGTAAGGGAVYGLGLIGALAYFLRAAESGRDYLLVLPKAVLWPALLVYRLLKSLGA